MSNAPMEPSSGSSPASPLYDGRRSYLRLALGVALPLVLLLVLYWPVVRGQFIWDDRRLVEKDNPLVSGQFNLHTIWFQTDFPLTNVAFWAQWNLWGGRPAGYRGVNLGLHALSAALAWSVLRRLRIPGAGLAAVIFAVHPVCVASVARIAELKNTLSLPFYLLSLWSYLRFEDSRSPERPAGASGWYGLSLAAFLLGLLSKTSTVVLPLVLLGCALWRRGRLSWRDWLLTGPLFVLSLTFGLLTVWFQAEGAIAGETVQTENLAARLAGAARAVWFYVGKACLPLDLNLIYPRWQIDAAAPRAYLPLLLLAAGIALCWRFRRGWGRHVLFALGCFVAGLLPTLGLVDMHYLRMSRVSDHLEYLALIAPVALAAAALTRALGPRSLKAVAAVLLLALSVLTAQRTRVFASDESLWRDTLAKNPAAWCAHHNLGCLLAEKGNYAQAIEHFQAALRHHPQNAEAHSNLGQAFMMQGRFQDAEKQFAAALEVRPYQAEGHKLLALALVSQGRHQEALAHLRRALRLQPDTALCLQTAALFCQTGDCRRGVGLFQRVLVVKPDSVEALNNLAWVRATCADPSLRDGTEAIRLAEHACRLTHRKERMPLGTLAAAYAEAGRFPDAVATAEAAVALATAAGDTRFAALSRQLQRLYRTGKPWHEPTSESPPTAR